ncbi:magnesium transporter [Compostibacter hankyongensis]|uniref:Magnesium transporter MgtE n=2 Tax=Compostibacter hankyongensis TaxID=1007089 RepID=A0ABP8G8E6_9BACT
MENEMLTEIFLPLAEEGSSAGLQELLDEQLIMDIAELIDEYPQYENLIISNLSVKRAVSAFKILDFPTQERIIKSLPGHKVAELINELPPDDRTALLSELPSPVVKELLKLMNAEERKIALSLLGYPEDSVGRLMTPDYLDVEPGWTVRQVLDHIREHGKDSETIDVIYIVDEYGKLMDDIRIREILLVDPATQISALMDGRFTAFSVSDSQEEAINVFRKENRVALPVTDEQDILLGIVTIDDVLWLANEEYTEDIQKIGGTEALDEPYLDIALSRLVRKRASVLIILFLSEMLTTTAMQHYQETGIFLSVADLILFIPLIMSSGGNSGSQASTLIIQAMALGEVGLADWWRVMRRELISGLLLGMGLGAIGFIRVLLWQELHIHDYGPHWILMGLTIFFSLIGVILWGSLIGSMLPIVLKKFKADPATSSAPFVATLVDVVGIVIYCSIAAMIMRGMLH